MTQPVVIPDQSGREVVVFTTPSGVTGIVDTSIPRAVVDGFIRKLRRKRARRLSRSTTK
jgi:hypothetical protein